MKKGSQPVFHRQPAQIAKQLWLDGIKDELILTYTKLTSKELKNSRKNGVIRKNKFLFTSFLKSADTEKILSKS